MAAAAAMARGKGRLFKAFFSRSLCRSSSSTSSSSSTTTTTHQHLVGSLPSTMRAAVFWEPGRPMTIEDLQMPRPKAGEILIKTKACGVCHSDLHIIKKDQPFPVPAVLGHEVTGEVVEHGPLTGESIVNRFPIGAHVVGAFIMPCGGCFYCTKGQEDLCETFFKYSRGMGTLYDGETRLFQHKTGKPIHMYSMGGLAEYCVVPAHGLAVLPESVPYSESAILGCAVFTAYGALKNAADMRAGETVAVVGTGGVGSSCLQLARAFGGRKVIAVDINDSKLEKAKTLGATDTINALKEDVPEKIKEITSGRGVDVAIEALGNPKTFVQSTLAIRDGGKAVIVGLASWGTMAEVDMVRLVRRQIRIIGSYGARARQDLPTIIGLAEIGAFDVKSMVTRKHTLEEADQVYVALDKGEIHGRAIVEL